MRVAIAGLGPKGLYALERLAAHASDAIDVDVYEPHPAPGAGPNYHPSLPMCLRMNVEAGHVDLWGEGSDAVPASSQRSFAAWSGRTGERVREYPARAEVGRYLVGGLSTVLEHLPATVRVRIRREAVRDIEASGRAWRVSTGADRDEYDEVLVATGHVQGSPFPVERWLSLDRVPPRGTIAVRGFALSFLDVARVLAETRAASDRPVRILPFSRTGRAMRAKPGTAFAEAFPALGPIAARGRAALLELEGPLQLERDVLPVLARVAEASLGAAGGRGEPSSWLAPSSLPAEHELRRSLAISHGDARPDPVWAIGHSWRALYPALVERLSGDGLATRDWPAFHRLAAELERVAFGPSAANVARLLELIEEGLVDLSFVAGGRVREHPAALVLGGATRRIDALVEAVLPPPGVVGDGTLAGRLVVAGHGRVRPHRRGLDVLADGTLVRADGACSGGLAAIGRPTEDAIVGNDTLTRSLHGVADAWARRVAARAAGVRVLAGAAP